MPLYMKKKLFHVMILLIGKIIYIKIKIKKENKCLFIFYIFIYKL